MSLHPCNVSAENETTVSTHCIPDFLFNKAVILAKGLFVILVTIYMSDFSKWKFLFPS